MTNDEVYGQGFSKHISWWWLQGLAQRNYQSGLRDFEAWIFLKDDEP